MMGKVLKYILGSIVLAAVAYLLLAVFYDTPEEEALERENVLLRQELAKMEERTDLLENVVDGLQERDASLYREIFNSTPPTYLVNHADSSRFDISNLAQLGEVELVWLAHRNVTRMDTVAARTAAYLDEIAGKLDSGKVRPSAIPSIIPLRSFSITQTGASVGMKFNPFFKTIRLHEGIDLMAPAGTPVVATADGQVTAVERKEKGFGNRVVITHPGGIKTVYAHLQEVKVGQGQSVRRGSIIGLVGASGRAFAPHLHYEVLKDGKRMEPVHYFFADLNELTYRDMLMMAMTAGQSMD